MKVQGHSLWEVLLFAYPELPLRPWRFHLASSRLKSHLGALVFHMQQVFGIDRPEDWRRVSAERLKQVDLFHVVQRLGGLAALLKQVYPEETVTALDNVSASKKAGPPPNSSSPSSSPTFSTTSSC